MRDAIPDIHAGVGNISVVQNINMISGHHSPHPPVQEPLKRNTGHFRHALNRDIWMENLAEILSHELKYSTNIGSRVEMNRPEFTANRGMCGNGISTSLFKIAIRA
jgi:hypothetical protein